MCSSIFVNAEHPQGSIRQRVERANDVRILESHLFKMLSNVTDCVVFLLKDMLQVGEDNPLTRAHAVSEEVRVFAKTENGPSEQNTSALARL